MKRWRVLSTKKLDQPVVESLKTEGIDIAGKEFISINPIVETKTLDAIQELVSGGIKDVVFTSKNAVEAFYQLFGEDESLQALPVRIFCLEGATRTGIEQTASIPGNNIIAGAYYAVELAQKIIDAEVKAVIFPCGNQRRDDLPPILNDHGITVHEFVVYETIETPVVVNDPFDAVMFFSPSGVRSFFRANKLPAPAICFSIGATTAEEIKKFAINKIVIADRPSQEAMAEIIVNHFKQTVN